MADPIDFVVRRFDLVGGAEVMSVDEPPSGAAYDLVDVAHQLVVDLPSQLLVQPDSQTADTSMPLRKL